jgi:hypothetical protein
MKKSLTEYASAISGSDIDILEELVCKKYRKFIRAFRILEDKSDSIKSMKYEVTEDKSVLALNITFTKSISLNDKKDMINEMKDSGYVILAHITGKKMKLQIKYDEV